MTTTNQAVNVTQVQTPTATRATAHLLTLSVTASQAPTLERGNSFHKTLTATQVQV